MPNSLVLISWNLFAKNMFKTDVYKFVFVESLIQICELFHGFTL